MIDRGLYAKISALSADEIAALKLSLLGRLTDAQGLFERGEITELELIAKTMAINTAIGELPLFHGAPRSLSMAVNGTMTRAANDALLERAEELDQ